MSTLPNMPNDPIRNYYPLFSVKRGSERVSNLPKATQQRNIRVIEEVEPRLSRVCGGGVGMSPEQCAEKAENPAGTPALLFVLPKPMGRM